MSAGRRAVKGCGSREEKSVIERESQWWQNERQGGRAVAVAVVVVVIDGEAGDGRNARKIRVRHIIAADACVRVRAQERKGASAVARRSRYSPPPLLSSPPKGALQRSS